MISPYSENDLQRIKEAQNYKDLLAVAMDVLNDFYRDNFTKPMAMICGPISTGGKGSRDANLVVFDTVIKRLSAGGLYIFTQMPFERDMKRIYDANPELQGLILLEQFYLPIFKSGYIKMLCFMPGWEKSVGANWEYKQALNLNIPRIYLSDFYTN